MKQMSFELNITSKNNNGDFANLENILNNIIGEIDCLKNQSVRSFDGEIDLIEEVKNYEIKLIKIALRQTCGSQSQAARILGTHKNTLNAKIKRYKINSL